MLWKKKLTVIFTILASISLVLFVMILYQKIQSWFSDAIGDSNWSLIILAVLIVIFVLAGFISAGKIKKKFFT